MNKRERLFLRAFSFNSIIISAHERKKMFKPIKYILFSVTMITSLLITSCGADSTTDEVIQTAVAQTVAAQNTEQAMVTETPSVLATQTPLSFDATLTPLGSLASPTATLNLSKAECAKASLTSETIADGTVFKPGEQFTKTWQITNTSNCVWDTNYKIVFWDGDIMGGGYVYNLPQVTGPGQTIPISLVLTAPVSNGTFRSEWKLQTPDKIPFGVGLYDNSFYTEIVVSDAKKPPYGILSVDYNITRRPTTGCPFNIWYTVYATITVSGPYEFSYYWAQKDGNDSGIKTVFMDKAGSMTISREWKVSIIDSQNDRWMQIIVTDPVYREYGKATWPFECK